MGIATSVASTVVLLKVLIDHGVLDTPQGHVAVGWLLVEDIITIIVLVLLPVLAASGTGDTNFFNTFLVILFKFGLLCSIVMVAGGKLVPVLLIQVAKLRSQELFTLTILVLSISVAAFSYFAFGTSMALGAFLAGMVVGQSPVSHQAGADLLPMRDAFSVLFFVSAGMLFDYTVIINYPLLTLGVLLIVLIAKPLAALLIMILYGYPLKVSLTVAAALAQIGEFSFILAEVGTKLELMPKYGQSVLVAVAFVSISSNTYVYRWLTGLEPALLKFAPLRKWLDTTQEKRVHGAHTKFQNAPGAPNKEKAIIIGYGIVGRTVTRVLEKMGIEPLIIESNIDTVREIQATGRRAIYGDATRRDILEAGGLKEAKFLIITISAIKTTIAILEAVHLTSKSVTTFVRCHYERDRFNLLNAGASAVPSEEVLVATAMAENILALNFTSKLRIRKETKRIQEEIKIEVANLNLT